MLRYRLLPMLGVVLAIGMIVVASAGAGGKGGFEPKTGKYSGTYVTSKGSFPATATVEKSGGKYVVQVLIGAPATCTDTTVFNVVALGVPAPLKGRSFAATQNVSAAGAGGTTPFAVKISGHFTSEKALTGTVSGEAKSVPGAIEPTTCTTGSVSFTVKHG